MPFHYNSPLICLFDTLACGQAFTHSRKICFPPEFCNHNYFCTSAGYTGDNSSPKTPHTSILELIQHSFYCFGNYDISPNPES